MTHINIFLFFLGLIPLNESNQLDSNYIEQTSSYVTVDESEGKEESPEDTANCPDYPFC